MVSRIQNNKHVKKTQASDLVSFDSRFGNISRNNNSKKKTTNRSIKKSESTTIVQAKSSLKLDQSQDEFNLTDREIEILRWLTEGKSSWDIGKILSISERTVKFHVNNICSKLDAVNRTHAVAKAILNKLI